MQKFLTFTNLQQIEKHASDNNLILLVYDDYVLDATSFAHHHPGGAGLILNYQSKDVSEQMKGHHPLSLKYADSIIIGGFKKEVSRLIDPSKALMDQIWDMNHEDYMKVVENPHWLFVPSPPMFDSKFNEWFTHNRWHCVFPIPVFLMIMWIATTDFSTEPLKNLIITFIIGMFSFTLLEYFLHRFIFHSEKWLPNNKVIRYIHYTLHGIHHTLPNDPDRLVYPPTLFFFTYLILQFGVFNNLKSSNEALNIIWKIGFLIGYMCYDLTHYALHHVDTTKSKGSYFHKLQRYHNQHHFGGEEAGYGVSSKFWDIVFRTEFKNKLSTDEHAKTA